MKCKRKWILFLCAYVIFFGLHMSIFSQTVLRHNELLFSNDGGFYDTMHEESIYTTIPDTVDYLDSMEWLIATANLSAQSLGTMNLIIRDPDFGQAMPEKHLWAGPWVGGDGAEDNLFARVRHYSGVGGLDPSLVEDLEGNVNSFTKHVTSTQYKLGVDLISVETVSGTATASHFRPFISDFNFGTSLYENLMFINTEYETLSGGNSGVSIEVYEALDITLERANPKKLGLQMEGGDLFAHSVYVDGSAEKVMFSNVTLNYATDRDLSGSGYGQLHVKGNVLVTGKIFGQIGTFDSYVLKQHISYLCLNQSNTTQPFYTTKYFTDLANSNSNSNDDICKIGNYTDSNAYYTYTYYDLSGTSKSETINAINNLSSGDGLYQPAINPADSTASIGAYINAAATDAGESCSGYKNKHGTEANCPGYMPGEQTMLNASAVIDVTNATLFNGSSSRTSDGYFTPDSSSTNAFLMAQATVGNETSLSYHSTFCMKLRWIEWSTSGVKYQSSSYAADTLLIDPSGTTGTGTTSTNANAVQSGYSAASCKDYHGSNESTATLTNLMAIPMNSGSHYNFYLYIYPIYEDQATGENTAYPLFLDVSNVRLSIISLPVGTSDGSIKTLSNSDTITVGSGDNVPGSTVTSY